MKKSTFSARGGLVFLTFLIIATFVLALSRAVVSNRISTSGIILDRINNEINFYKTANATLSEKFLSQSSLTNISSQAGELGFIEKKDKLILVPLPVALKR